MKHNDPGLTNRQIMFWRIGCTFYWEIERNKFSPNISDRKFIFQSSFATKKKSMILLVLIYFVKGFLINVKFYISYTGYAIYPPCKAETIQWRYNCGNISSSASGWLWYYRYNEDIALTTFLVLLEAGYDTIGIMKTSLVLLVGGYILLL